MSLADALSEAVSNINKTAPTEAPTKKFTREECDIIEYDIKSFINKEYKGYALSVTRERALPCVIDGFKPSQRKAMYVIPKVAGTKSKHKKVAALAGSVIAEGIYHHGDVALADTISLIAAEWYNNVPLLDTSGIFGSRLSGVDGIASPRYTSARVHDNWTKYFGDEDILTYGEGEEDKEPKFFMPIIPWVLVNGVSGVAVGYASEIMPYKISEIIENIKLYMDGKEMKPMLPYFKGYKGRIYRTAEGTFMEGVYKRENSNTIIVTEIPVGVTAEAYKKLLITLEEKEVITDFFDRCKNGFHFEIKHKRGALDQFEDEYKVLGLRAKLNENINCIGEDDGKQILTFANANDVIKYFVDHRLSYVMPTRKAFQLNKLSEEISYLESLYEFLKAVVIAKNIQMNNIESKSDLLEKMIRSVGKKLSNEHAQKISGIPIYRLNKEYMDVVYSELQEKCADKLGVEEKSYNDMYMDDLRSIEEKK